MFYVLFFLGIGIVTGVLIHRIKWISPVIEKSVSVAIYLLLFSLGLKAGLNESIMSQLHKLGLTALIISSFAILGSSFVAKFAYKLFFKNKER